MNIATVGLYLLSELAKLYGKSIGLYRDDGLAAFKKTLREIEGIKKQVCRFFSEKNLKITIEANKKSVNYLSITLDLRNGTYVYIVQAIHESKQHNSICS